MNVVISLNKFTAILIFLLAVVYIFLTEGIGAGHSAGGMVDAKFIPRLIAGALLICSICIFFEKDKKKINFGIGKSILKVFIRFPFSVYVLAANFEVGNLYIIIPDFTNVLLGRCGTYQADINNFSPCYCHFVYNIYQDDVHPLPNNVLRSEYGNFLVIIC